MSKHDPLGLTTKQWAAIHQLEAEGYAIAYLGNKIGADPQFHLYRDSANHRVTINEEGAVTWEQSSTATTSGS